MYTSDPAKNALSRVGCGMSSIFSRPNRVTVFPSGETETGSSIPVSGIASRSRIRPSGSQEKCASNPSAGSDGTGTAEISASETFSGAGAPGCFESCAATALGEPQPTHEINSAMVLLLTATLQGLLLPEGYPCCNVSAAARRD